MAARKSTSQLDTELSVLKNDVGYIKDAVDRIEVDVKEALKEIKAEYVPRAEFNPVRNVVYGAVGVILMAVLGALIALVVMKP